MTKTEKVIFNVIKTENGWKIKSPDFLTPHVNPAILIKDLQGCIKKERDAAKIQTLLADIAIIKQLSSMK